MSFTIRVIGTIRVGEERVAELISGIGLRALVGGGVVQAYGDDGRLWFEVNSAASIDHDDVPVSMSVPGGELWQVNVEVKSGEGVEEQFYHALTQEMAGAMFDESSGQVWPPRLSVSKIPARTPVRALSLAWYGFYNPDGPPLVTVLMEGAKRWLGTPLVRRYGSDEPLRYSVEKDGADKLIQAWREADMLFLFSCLEFPFSYGSVTPLACVQPSGGMWEITLAGVADAFMDDPGARLSLQSFFTGVAAMSGAVYATAEVEEGWIWSGKQLFTQGGRSGKPRGVFRLGFPSLLGRQDSAREIAKHGLLGVTSYPTWWSWFGGGYLPLVADRLKHAPSSWLVTRTDAGVLVRLSELPATETELRGRLARWLGRGWMPASLISRNLRPARVRPRP